MKCQNCLKEIPDGASSCGYCEAKQQRVDLESANEAMEILESTDPALLAELKSKMPSAETAEDFASMILCPPCPACGSEKVETCGDVAGFDNPMIGRCRVCCALFCTDCSHVFHDEKEATATFPTPQCPSCGGTNTSFPEDDDEEEFPDLVETIECFDCGKIYCFACGHVI